MRAQRDCKNSAWRNVCMSPLNVSKGEASASRDQVLLLPNGVEHPPETTLLRTISNKCEGNM